MMGTPYQSILAGNRTNQIPLQHMTFKMMNNHTTLMSVMLLLLVVTRTAYCPNNEKTIANSIIAGQTLTKLELISKSLPQSHGEQLREPEPELDYHAVLIQQHIQLQSPKLFYQIQ